MTDKKYWGADTVTTVGGEVVEVDFPHVVLSQQFSWEDLERLFKLTKILKQEIPKRTRKDWLSHIVMASVFYEASTRTRFSFESAASRLGAAVISSENAADFSSAIKGETLEDTIRIISDKADVIVLRHKDNDSSIRAARFSGGVPIFNGGAGKGQHPTQGKLDTFTIYDRFDGQIDGLKIGIGGDLKRGRTARSLAYNLAKRDVEIFFVAPQIAQMGKDVLDHLTEAGVKWHQVETFREIIDELDVLYMTRFQIERAETEEEQVLMAEAAKVNIIDKDLVSQMRPDSILMHPLPRIEEIRWGVDKDPRAVYFEQAANGDYIRMALLLCVCNPVKAEELLNR